MESKKLAKLLAEGEHVALKTLYDDYSRRIYGFCVKSNLSQEDAKDVLQEVFVRIWNQRKTLTPDIKIESYIFSIARNIIADKFRLLLKNKIALEYQIYLMTPTNSTESMVYYNELKEEIDRTFNSMPEMRKLVFQLSRFKGYSNKEIAEELGISPRTVESHISKALQSFRINLGQSTAVIAYLLLLLL